MIDRFSSKSIYILIMITTYITTSLPLYNSISQPWLPWDQPDMGRKTHYYEGSQSLLPFKQSPMVSCAYCLPLHSSIPQPSTHLFMGSWGKHGRLIRIGKEKYSWGWTKWRYQDSCLWERPQNWSTVIRSIVPWSKLLPESQSKSFKTQV